MATKLNCDAQADAVCVRFASHIIVESEDIRPGVIFDFDADGPIVAIEILEAKGTLSQPALSAAE